jgi:hypothetical protein
LPDLIEALWEAGERVGRRLSVSDQVAVARELARQPPRDLTARDINDIFTRLELIPPSEAYGRAVLSRVKNLRPTISLGQVLIDYRQFAIRSLSGQFGGRTTGQEESLRNNVLTYLPRRGYTEARTGKGRSDILVPPPQDAIIEVKIWAGVPAYEDGLVELGRYIHTERPSQAHMVVFGDREPLPSIVRNHRQAIAEERHLEGLVVPVVVVPFEVDQPSKAAGQARRRERRG